MPCWGACPFLRTQLRYQYGTSRWSRPKPSPIATRPNRPYPLTRTPYLHVNFCFSFETNHPPDSEKPILWQISIMGSLQAAWFFVLGQSVIAQQYSSSAPLSTSIPSASLLPHCGYYDVYTYLHLRSAVPSLLPPEGLEQNYHTHAFVRTV